ncbi:energy-coupling factor transporter transmembrane component T family protein [Microbacterium testaceum]|uniref:energy-coupling factor transporter transmembrane component T family protein n=1 Tax=Microbacterium testaceum TaxID=2033 RepID=UPI0025B113BE|nr:energy-coupling factor transporter transmembrane protein EcfT [Microbacterium testaceum]WJS90603.1 energy-coupling factor transporter transmembrane protein EcfT [Microbacterium testaceum]
MLSLYRPGGGWMHRMPAGPKITLLTVVALLLAALPFSWTGALIAVVVPAVLYLGAGMGVVSGVRELARQGWALRGVVVLTGVGQLIFLGPEPAAVNTARVVSALLVVGLLPLTTRVSSMLDAMERGMTPLGRIGIDPVRVALLLTVTLTTIPVLARLAAEVREAQRARGLRPSFARGALPFLVVALRHADDLGDALAARGIR